jgi:mediator of RNA polymerase II transcription subunit 12
MDLTSTARVTVSAALQWASSPYRDGCYRIYLATRLIRKWSLLGADTDDAILAYFHSTERDVGADQRNAFRVVAELIRSQTFSVGKYLQWLIATGSISRSQDITLQTSWPLRLVTEIPLTGLPPQVRNLRSTLLRGTNYSTEQEEQSLGEAESIVRRTLPILFADPILGHERNELNIPRLSSSVQYELAMILRKQVAANIQLIEHVPTKDPSVEEPAVVCTISVQEYHSVRMYLEGFGDYAILADIIGVVATSLDSHVLAAAADTLNYHRLALRCIGAFEPLFGKIAMRYAAIRTVRFPERELLVSLTDLCRNILVEGDLVQALAYDLGRHDQKNVVAACSPVSDTMADATHTMPGDSEEEIDRILSSGTSMDHQTMARVFGKIVFSLKDQITKSIIPSGYHAAWFYRLRSFDESCFDGIVIEWTTSLLIKGQSKMIHAAIPPLVVSGCLTLSQFQDITSRAITKTRTTSQEDSLRICMHALDVLLPTDSLTPLCQPHEAYRYRLEQQNFCQGSNVRILHLLRDLFDSITEALSPSSQSPLKGLLSSERLRTVVKRHISLNGEILSDVLGVGTQSFSAAASAQLKTLLDSLFDPTNRLGLSRKSLADQVKTIVESASCLSLPFCQLEIRQLFAIASVTVDTAVDTMSGSLVEAIRSAIERDDTPWNDLVAGLDTGLRTKIRENAERELLQASAFFSGPATFKFKTSSVDDEIFLRKHLTVINLTSSGTFTDLEAPIFATLVERLKGIADTLSDSQRRIGQLVSSPDPSLRSWLNALLRLALIHGSMLLHKAPNQHQAAILWSLRLLFTHPALDSYPVIMEYIFDIAVFLSDSISDDVRNHLIKMNTAKTIDEPRCTFLFGRPSSFDGWLALTRPVAPSSSAQSTPTAQQHVQQNNNGPSQQQFHNQQLQSPGSAALQRSLGQQHQQQQTQGQNLNRMYPQYPQHPQQNKTLSHFQRMSNNNGSQSQLQQMQQLQQLQGLAQQRSAQSSPLQMQRQPAPPSQSSGAQAGRPGAVRQEKPEIKTLPYALKRWEILPESGGNPAGNETAISLSLFGARRA